MDKILKVGIFCYLDAQMGKPYNRVNFIILSISYLTTLNGEGRLPCKAQVFA